MFYLTLFKVSTFQAIMDKMQCNTLSKKYPYSELFWFALSHVWTEYGKIRSICPYSVQMRENADQNNFEYEHFSRSDIQ